MIADELKRRRVALGLSQARLGLLLGTSPANVHLWERGVHPVPAWVDAKLIAIEATRWGNPSGNRVLYSPAHDAPMPAEEFKRRRVALDLTQRRLAQLLGIATSTVATWEQGRSPVAAHAIEKLEEIERTRWPKKLE